MSITVGKPNQGERGATGHITFKKLTEDIRKSLHHKKAKSYERILLLSFSSTYTVHREWCHPW